jgi:hypothetical protein
MNKYKEILGEEEFNRIEELDRKQRFLIESGKKRGKSQERGYKSKNLPISPEKRKDFINNYFYMRKNKNTIRNYLGLTVQDYENLKRIDPEIFEEAKRKCTEITQKLIGRVLRVSDENKDWKGIVWAIERMGGVTEGAVEKDDEEARMDEAEEFARSAPRPPYSHLLHGGGEEE